MNPLVEQFAAAGQFGIAAPLKIIARTTSMSVAGAYEHRLTNDTRSDQLTCAYDRGIMTQGKTQDKSAIILRYRMEARFAREPFTVGSSEYRRNFGSVASTGLFAENAFSSSQGSCRDGSEILVRRRDNDRIYVFTFDQLLPVCARSAAYVGGQRNGRLRDCVDNLDGFALRMVLGSQGTNSSHATCTNDPDPQLLQPRPPRLCKTQLGHPLFVCAAAAAPCISSNSGRSVKGSMRRNVNQG